MKINVVVVTQNERGDYTRLYLDRWVETAPVASATQKAAIKRAIASAKQTARALDSQGVPAKVLVDGVEAS